MSKWRAQPQGETVEVQQPRRPQFMKKAGVRSVCLMTSPPGLGSSTEDAVDSIGCRLLLWEGLLQSHFSLTSPPLMYTSLIPWVIFLSIHGSPKATLCCAQKLRSLEAFNIWILYAWCLCMSIQANRIHNFHWVVHVGEFEQVAPSVKLYHVHHYWVHREEDAFLSEL